MKTKPRNFIAKYDYLINTAKTFKDRKKEFKKGKEKYKQNYKMDSYESILFNYVKLHHFPVSFCRKIFQTYEP